ncbi:hypothetical protein BDV23DRAFT_182473 [Aspergillus alliaceus]|uniref:Cyanovirin-N domain-containing protein n=1 Tax=Petromyces alliaceus TaxID=209559 RepID=A0A5N7CBA8_PETAA|nr:hypothetical protein BDV23DRAFT_182473 [Aspergillus alliaceus]
MKLLQLTVFFALLAFSLAHAQPQRYTLPDGHKEESGTYFPKTCQNIKVTDKRLEAECLDPGKPKMKISLDLNNCLVSKPEDGLIPKNKNIKEQGESVRVGSGGDF